MPERSQAVAAAAAFASSAAELIDTEAQAGAGGDGHCIASYSQLPAALSCAHHLHTHIVFDCGVQLALQLPLRSSSGDRPSQRAPKSAATGSRLCASTRRAGPRCSRWCRTTGRGSLEAAISSRTSRSTKPASVWLCPWLASGRQLGTMAVCTWCGTDVWLKCLHSK